MRVAVIINPESGSNAGPGVGRERAGHAARYLTARRVDFDVSMTERPGHAADLARAALARSASIVCAWGGDGTVNEVASVLAFTDAALAIVPHGSGNGLARDLGIPRRASAALSAMLDGVDRVIDAGELGGRLFVSIAGIGFDACVAKRFAERTGRRGFGPYVTIAAREFWSYTPRTYTITVGQRIWRQAALAIILANSRQYGNGALIAPSARLDDGHLSLVVVGAQSPGQMLLQWPRLFTGSIERLPGVISLAVEGAAFTAEEPMWFHVDGEPVAGSVSRMARVHPGAVRVRVPAAAGPGAHGSTKR